MGNAARAAWRRGAYFALSAGVSANRFQARYYMEKEYASRVGLERAAKDLADKRLRGEPIYTNDTEDLHINALLKEQPLHHGLEVAGNVASCVADVVVNALKSGGIAQLVRAFVW